MSPINQFIQQIIAAKKISIDQLTQLLHVSEATMRRKLHGDSAFTIDEVYVLQQQFGFSIDAMAPNAPADKKLFTTKEFELLESAVATVENYIDNLLADFGKLGALGTPHLYYAAKDLPLFCFFSSGALTSFKLYFWYITIFDAQATKLKFHADWLPAAVLEKAKHLYAMYNAIPSTEIWNTETINSTLHQIEYGVQIGSVAKADAIQILKALHTFIDTLQEHAEQQCKNPTAVFKMYINEILLLDNTVLFEIGEHKLFYLPYQTLNFLSTSDPSFTNKAFAWFAKQTAKSTLISGEAEKDRTRVMNLYRAEIEKVEGRM
jgi:transcriptional regulator with XRE-family HTH domain